MKVDATINAELRITGQSASGARFAAARILNAICEADGEEPEALRAEMIRAIGEERLASDLTVLSAQIREAVKAPRTTEERHRASIHAELLAACREIIAHDITTGSSLSLTEHQDRWNRSMQRMRTAVALATDIE